MRKLLFLSFCLWLNFINAQNEREILFYIDSNKTVSDEAIVNGKIDSLLGPYQKGYSTKNEAFNYILKSSVVNTNTSHLLRYLVLNDPLVSEVVLLYKNENGKIIQNRSGLLYYGVDSIPSARTNFPINIPPNKTLDFYLVYKGSGAIQHLDFKLLTPKENQRKNETEFLLFGVFYGMIILLILVNLFYFFTLKNKVFLIYTLNVFFVFFFYSILDCFPFLGAMPYMGPWHHQFLILAVCLNYTFLPYMAFYYLGLDKTGSVKLKRMVHAFFFFGILASIVPFIFNGTKATEAFLFYYSLFVVACVPFLIIIIVKGRKVDKVLSRNFLIAYLILITSSVLSFLDSMGILYFGLGFILFKAGTICELSILSFSLALRFRKTEFEYKNVQKQHLSLQDRFFRAQINPHFIFNVLTSINTFVNKNERQKASEYLVKFSRLIRLVLDSTTNDHILLENELKMLENYAELEKLRANNAFEFIVKVDETINPAKTEVPAMLVQPYIENSIKHGVAEIEQKGLIQLIVKPVDQDTLEIIVDDNGIGLEASKRKAEQTRKKVGTQNVKERLKVLQEKHGTKLQVNISDKTESETGTIVRLTVPFQRI